MNNNEIKNKVNLEGSNIGSSRITSVSPSELEDNKKPGINKTKIIIILLIVIVLGLLIFCITKNNSNKNGYNIEKITDFNYFSLYENEKYGVMDRQGNYILKPEYDIIEVPNPTKDVFICYSNYDDESKEYKTIKVLNSKNEEIFKEYSKVLPIEFINTTSKIPYEKSILKYEKDGKWGLIDFKGKIVAKAKYDSIKSLPYKEGIVVKTENGKNGLMNMNGKIMIEPKYDSITADGYYNKETENKYTGFIVSQETENGIRYGYINHNCEKLLDVEYNQISRINEIQEESVFLLNQKNGLYGIHKNKTQLIDNSYNSIEYDYLAKRFLVSKQNKLGVFDENGKEILKPEFDDIEFTINQIIAIKDDITYHFDLNGNKTTNSTIKYLDLNSDVYDEIVNENGKYGVAKKNGEVIIDCKYDYIKYAFNNYFIATYNGKDGIINEKDELLIDHKFDVIQLIGATNAIQALLTETNTSYIYNSKLENVLVIDNAEINEINGYTQVISDTKMEYLDQNGNLVSNTEVYKTNKLFAKEQDGKWGFADKEGKMVVESKYTMVSEFNEYGFAGIKQDDKWGVIDENGNIILEPTYNNITWNNPSFIGKYCKRGYNSKEYYTNDLIKKENETTTNS